MVSGTPAVQRLVSTPTVSLGRSRLSRPDPHLTNMNPYESAEVYRVPIVLLPPYLTFQGHIDSSPEVGAAMFLLALEILKVQAFYRLPSLATDRLVDPARLRITFVRYWRKRSE